MCVFEKLNFKAPFFEKMSGGRARGLITTILIMICLLIPISVEAGKGPKKAGNIQDIVKGSRKGAEMHFNIFLDVAPRCYTYLREKYINISHNCSLKRLYSMYILLPKHNVVKYVILGHSKQTMVITSIHIAT